MWRKNTFRTLRYIDGRCDEKASPDVRASAWYRCLAQVGVCMFLLCPERQLAYIIKGVSADTRDGTLIWKRTTFNAINLDSVQYINLEQDYSCWVQGKPPANWWLNNRQIRKAMITTSDKSCQFLKGHHRRLIIGTFVHMLLAQVRTDFPLPLMPILYDHQLALDMPR
jgi:hypothetical protein